MTQRSLKKMKAREAREAREASHAEYVRQVRAERKADDEDEFQRGIVFTPGMGIQDYEKFPHRKIVSVGPKRFKYLRDKFPDNFKGAKLGNLKDEDEMKNTDAVENKAVTGAGAENKTADTSEIETNLEANGEENTDNGVDADTADVDTEADSAETELDTSEENTDNGEPARESDS